MITIRSFRSKILIALVVVALVPAVITVVVGTFVLQEVISSSGTAAPWEALAESGRSLLAEIDAAGVEEPELRAAAEDHRAALTESIRLSRLYTALSDRFLAILPALAGGTVVVVALLSIFVARILSRTFSRPIQEMVGWTERISRGEELPPEKATGPADVREFEHLRDALRAMASELAHGRRRAVESARLRSWTEMARSVAHDLKNPLGPMRMAAGTVAMMDDPRAPEAGRVLLEEIDRLDEMARSFSRLGRMPEGPTAPVDLEELMEEAVAPYDSSDPVRIRIEAEGDVPMVDGWYDSLLRVFQNLVGNAHHAAASGPERVPRRDGGDGADTAESVDLAAGPRMPPGKWVRVSIRPSPARSGHVEVEVADSGAGIPTDALDAIWEPDFTTKALGTGLGLTLVRHAVEAHGGGVTARNRPDAGAEFVVTLPVQRARGDEGEVGAGRRGRDGMGGRGAGTA